MSRTFDEADSKTLRIRELERRNNFLYDELRNIVAYRWHLNNVFKTDRQIAEDIIAVAEEALKKETAEITTDWLIAKE